MMIETPALRGAILGAGNVAIHGHVPGWLAVQAHLPSELAHWNVEIVAAADPRPEGRAALLERLPRLRWYASAEELLARETLDFVDICAPPSLHAPLIRAALNRGANVLCEKPLVISAEELAPLAALASEKGLVLSPVHNWRHSPILAAAGELLRTGWAGEILSCRWETLRTRPASAADVGAANWRLDPSISGGGVLMDHGWHALYVVCGWLPDAPQRVSARLSTRRHHEWPVEDTAELRLETPSGARAEILLTWAADARRNRVVIEGTRATIRLEEEILEFQLSGPDRAGFRRRFAQSLSDGSHHPEWFGGVAAEFLDHILTRREFGDTGSKPVASSPELDEARLCLEVIEAAGESSRRGGETLALSPRPLPRAREREGRAHRVGDLSQATLWIESGGMAAEPGMRLHGLSLLRQAAVAGTRAGFERIFVEEVPGRDLSAILAKTSARVVTAAGPDPDVPPGRLVVVSPRAHPEAWWLKELVLKPIYLDRLALDPGHAAVLETRDHGSALSILRSRGNQDALDSLSRLIPRSGCELPARERSLAT